MKDKMTAKEFREAFVNKTTELFKQEPKRLSNLDRLLILNPSVPKLGTLDLYIGIDPGTKTGFAVWEVTNKQFMQIETTCIHNALFSVHSYSQKFNIKVIIEDARLRKWFGTNSENKQQGAGSVKRDCSIWEDFLTDYSIAFEMVHPMKGSTKWTAELFSKTTGYTKKTTSHSRDAALLIFNKN